MSRNTEEIHGGRSCDHRGRDRGDESISQEARSPASNYQKLERTRAASSLRLPKGINPANILVLDFWLPEV
jgi:hypothetical protein